MGNEPFQMVTESVRRPLTGKEKAAILMGELGGSRWTYVEALVKFAIEQDRCSELLSYILSVEMQNNAFHIRWQVF